MPRTIWISILLSAALSGACAASRPSTEQVAAALGRPIDCANGERDIIRTVRSAGYSLEVPVD